MTPAATAARALQEHSQCLLDAIRAGEQAEILDRLATERERCLESLGRALEREGPLPERVADTLRQQDAELGAAAVAACNAIEHALVAVHQSRNADRIYRHLQPRDALYLDQTG